MTRRAALAAAILALAILLLGYGLGRAAGPASRSEPVWQRVTVTGIREAVGAGDTTLTTVELAPGSSNTASLILEPAVPTQPIPRAQPDQPAAVAVSKNRLTGIASYYDWRPGEAAACAPLRAALGAAWRGSVVTVNGIAVRLTDYCPQTGRLIDLDRRTFEQLAPLSQGLVRVSVTWAGR